MHLFRSAINFPAIFHMKCTEEMKAQIHAHGGANGCEQSLKPTWRHRSPRRMNRATSLPRSPVIRRLHLDGEK